MNLLFEHPAAAPPPSRHAHPLRPYQVQAVDAIFREWEASPSTLLVMATGTGKTRTFSEVIGRSLPRGRAMVLAHRRELIDQAATRIGRDNSIRTEIEMADDWADMGRVRAPVIVSSIQTLVSGGPPRMERFDPRQFAVLVIDEAHHVPADTYRRVIGYFTSGNPDLRVLGVTATPDRTDEAALGQVFKTVAFTYEINDAIADGFLVPVRQRSVTVDGLDFSGVSTTAGDLNGGELAALMEYEEEMHGMVSSCVDLVGERQTLVFASSVAHAERICEILNRHSSDCARYVTGKTAPQERRRIFSDYNSGGYQFLVNVGVVTEGTDLPTAQVIVMGRPTKSRSLFTQMVGRGLRPLPGVVDRIDDAPLRCSAIEASPKPFCEVIDFVGNAGRHKLVTTADILGGEYEDAIVERAAEIARDADEPMDTREALKQAKREAQEIERHKAAEEGEKRRRAHLKGVAHYSTAVIDAFDLFDIEPARLREWDRGVEATENQVRAIVRESGGAITETDAAHLSRKHATQLIDRYFAKPTEKQARQLRRFGLPDDVDRPTASKLMAAIFADGSGGRRPDPATLDAILGGRSTVTAAPSAAAWDGVTVVDGSEVEF